MTNEKERPRLTPRQRALRRFLWSRRTEWVSSKEINDDYHAINGSGEYDKKIIPDRARGYKLATKAEFGRWAKKAYAEAIRKIVYVCAQIKDAKMDGQGIIPGLEGYQREFYEKFVKEETTCKKNGDRSPSKSSNATAS